MTYTPVEVRHVRFRRGVLGYRRRAVEETLTHVADSFEEVYRERAELADEVERLEADLVRHRELETLLRTTLMSAERTAQELQEQARREARLILEEAHAEARTITRDALVARERLEAQARRARTLLGSALDAVDDALGVDSVGAPQREAEAA
jgi:cell division initiation protein